MAAARKRKHASVDENTLTSTPSQQDIRRFASVRKSSQPADVIKKRKVVHERLATPSRSVDTAKAERKRKRDAEADAEDDENKSSQESVNCVSGDRTHGQTDQANALKARSKRTKTATQPPSPHETPSKKAAALFGKLELEATVSPVPFAINTSKSVQHPLESAIESAEFASQGLPVELNALVHLNAAFLSALSLYYAHNGTSSPVDVKTLLPMITANWKRRTVSLDDLRTVLAVGREGAADFTLWDYGKGGIRMVKEEPRGRTIKRAASYVDESSLKARFEESLGKRWAKWLASAAQENRDVTVFIDQLPLVEISKHHSVDGTAAMFARGNQRLADLKASQAAAKAESVHPSKLASDGDIRPAAQNRGTSLLDRILSKQALSSSLPAGPTREQLERKAALHRVEDIARVLDLLAAGRSRCSFSVQALVQRLQQSLRSPIGKEEVQKCLDLMTTEITPGFVSVVRNGSISCVVITVGGKIGLDELRRRIQDSLTVC